MNNFKVVVVTGAASGIGAAVVRNFLDSGDHVVAVDLSGDALKTLWSDESNVTQLAANVTDRERLSSGIERVVKEVGAPSVLVNCAGIYRASNLLDTTDEDFDVLFDVNVKGTFIPAQIVARAMITAKLPGAIINITSVSASEATAENGAYAASKGAVGSLTRGLAVSLAEHGIRVNAVQPGPIATPQGKQAIADPVYAKRMLGRGLVKRLAEPEEVASAIAFLAGDGAGYITGTVLTVDGGVLANR